MFPLFSRRRCCREMAEAAFHPPRRKRRVFECYQAPLPVGPGAGDFRMCRADMVNNCVVVRSPEDMDQLYNKVLSVLQRALC